MAEAVLDNPDLAYADLDGQATDEALAEDREPIRWQRFTIFLLLLPFFGGTFSYVKDIRPLWAFAKAFPIVSLPVVLVLLRHPRVPVMRQLVITITYMILVPSFTGMFSFHQDFFTGLTSQVKLLPLIFFFSLLATLYLLQLSFREVSTAFLVLAIASFAVLIAIWIFAPTSWYATKFVAGQASILTVDNRGYRIRMPMYFGLIGIFYCFRRFYAGYKWPWLLLTVGLFSLLIYAIKTRSYIIGAALLLAINAVRFSRPAVRVFVLILLPLVFLGLANVPLVASVLQNQDPVRDITIGKILDFLGPSVTHWTLGVGSITPLDPAGMIIFFNHFFFLADVSWVGVVFEFGLIGAVLFLLVPLRGIWMSRKLKPIREDTFLGSLQDYLIYVVVTSPITAIILAPGEITVILAIFVYFSHRPRLREA